MESIICILTLGLSDCGGASNNMNQMGMLPPIEQPQPANPVPEPGAAILFATGLGAVAFLKKKKE